MADEENRPNPHKNPERYPEFARFKDHIKRIGVEDAPCPVCGAVDWGLSYKMRLQALDEAGEDDTMFFPAFPLICNNCGYMVLFNGNVIARTTAERQEKPEPSEEGT